MQYLSIDTKTEVSIFVVSVETTPAGAGHGVEAAVDIGLPVALVRVHVPLEAALAVVLRGRPVRTLVVHLAVVWIGKVSLGGWALKLALCGGETLLNVSACIPIVSGDGVERLQGRGLGMLGMTLFVNLVGCGPSTGQSCCLG